MTKLLQPIKIRHEHREKAIPVYYINGLETSKKTFDELLKKFQWKIEPTKHLTIYVQKIPL